MSLYNKKKIESLKLDAASKAFFFVTDIILNDL